MKTLHAYQSQLIDDVTEAARQGHKHILLQLATGGGKSVIAADFIRRVMDKGKKSAFIVPRRELVRQMDGQFNDFGLSHSFVADGYECNPFSRLHVCTVGTLVNRLDRINPDVVFFDESHICGGQFEKIMSHYKTRGAYCIGLSATPKRLDGKGLGRYYSHMVKGPSVRWLMDQGYLSDYRLFAPDDPNLTHKDFANKGRLEQRMEDDRVLIGNAMKHYKLHADGKLAVVFTMSRNHSEIIKEMAQAQGIRCAIMDGNTPDDERKRICKAFARREIDWLINCMLLTYGFDLASAADMDVAVECVIDLAPTESLALQWQKNGRGLRRKNQPAILLDHAGNHRRLGYMPDADIDWSLADDEKMSRSSSTRTIEVMQCAYCYRCFKPFLNCPACGRQREIQSREVEHIEGELAEVKAIQKREAKDKRIEVGKARTMDDLKRIAKERGYKSGWVYQQAKLKHISA